MLLGLTATPERTDVQSILEWFDGRFAAELRLWDALERGLLSPFHYFGVHDSIDLSSVRWVRGSYDIGELENLYTGNDARVRQIVVALKEKVTEADLSPETFTSDLDGRKDCGCVINDGK